jgi:hypothetical protein
MHFCRLFEWPGLCKRESLSSSRFQWSFIDAAFLFQIISIDVSWTPGLDRTSATDTLDTMSTEQVQRAPGQHVDSQVSRANHQRRRL